jgi:hypothetical protein
MYFMTTEQVRMAISTIKLSDEYFLIKKKVRKPINAPLIYLMIEQEMTLRLLNER